jgi:hypothetical protein
MTLAASSSARPAASTVTITGVSGGLSHTATVALKVSGIRTGTVPVDLSSTFNVTGIYADGSSFAPAASLDGQGYALSEQALGATQVWDEVLFKLGPANAPDAVTGKTVLLPAGKFASLDLLALAVESDQELQVFTVTYTDGTTSSFTQSLSDWYAPSSFSGESVAVSMPYRLEADGSKDGRTFHIYGYSVALDSSKVVRSLTLPANREILLFAATLVPVRAPA